MSATNIFGLPIVASEISVSGPAVFDGPVTFAETSTTSTGAPVAQLNELFVITPSTFVDGVTTAILTVPAGETWVIEAAMLAIPVGWVGGALPVLDVGFTSGLDPAGGVADGFLAAAPLDAPAFIGFNASERGANLWDVGATAPVETLLPAVAGAPPVFGAVTVTVTQNGALTGLVNLLIQGRKFSAIQLA